MTEFDRFKHIKIDEIYWTNENYDELNGMIGNRASVQYVMRESKRRQLVHINRYLIYEHQRLLIKDIRLDP